MTLLGKFVFGTIALLIIGIIVYGVLPEKSSDVSKERGTVVEDAPIKAVAEEASTTSSSTLSAPASTNSKPFRDVLLEGGSHTCNVTQAMANMTGTGTIFILDDKIKAEITMSIASQTITTTMIRRDGYIYSWTNKLPTQGNKTKIASAATKEASSSKVYTWDGSQITDYSCKDTPLEVSLFELPKVVTFTEKK